MNKTDQLKRSKILAKTTYSIIPILLLTLFLVVGAFAQDKSCTIEGTLTDADSKPAKNALVTIKPVRSNSEFTKRTDEKGYFSVSTSCEDNKIEVSEVKGIPTLYRQVEFRSDRKKFSTSIRKLYSKYYLYDARFDPNKPEMKQTQQLYLCDTFLNGGFKDFREELEGPFQTTIEDSFFNIKCDIDKRQDILKYRMRDSTGKIDLSAFIYYYVRIINREEDLAALFNINVPEPGWPSGTLIDFIEEYQKNEDLSANNKNEHSRIIKLIRKYGAKKASEL